MFDDIVAQITQDTISLGFEVHLSVAAGTTLTRAASGTAYVALLAGALIIIVVFPDETVIGKDGDCQ